MDPEDVQLLRESLARITPMGTALAAIFYDRLFQTAPHLRSMFPEDLTAQGEKLMSALAVLIPGLEKLETVVPRLHDLGRRHAAFGVSEAHYTLVGEALIWTLEITQGERLTPATRGAWIEAYGMLAEAMIAAPRLRAA